MTQAERAKLESHTIEGYYLLKRLQGVSERSARCALLHHERYDGIGYPYKLKQAQIEEFPQIIAISDVYDALISPRHHRHAFTPNEATEFLFAAGNHYFDLELVKAFLNHISIYPISSMVVLNNGKIGVVSSVDTGLLHRPVIKIIREADGSQVAKPYEINLMNNMDLVIVHSLKNEPTQLVH